MTRPPATHEQIRTDAERVIRYHWAGQERLTILANHCLSLLDENEKMQAAVRDAMDSLGTGPMRDGYAYSVLAAMLGDSA